jgi:hypothetical protein
VNNPPSCPKLPQMTYDENALSDCRSRQPGPDSNLASASTLSEQEHLLRHTPV